MDDPWIRISASVYNYVYDEIYRWSQTDRRVLENGDSTRSIPPSTAIAIFTNRTDCLICLDRRKFQLLCVSRTRKFSFKVNWFSLFNKETVERRNLGNYSSIVRRSFRWKRVDAATNGSFQIPSFSTIERAMMLCEITEEVDTVDELKYKSE